MRGWDYKSHPTRMFLVRYSKERSLTYSHLPRKSLRLIIVNKNPCSQSQGFFFLPIGINFLRQAGFVIPPQFIIRIYNPYFLLNHNYPPDECI